MAGVALIALLLGLAACNRSPEVGAAPKPPSVTVVAVAQRSVPVYGQYVGQTEAVKTVEVRARVEGFIERQVAPDGAHVKAGDLLFTIDPRPLEAALRQAEANVARDTAALHQAEAAVTQREADVRQAQANVERDLAQVEHARAQEGRYGTLFQQALIAKEQYDQIRTNMTALEATVQADRAALENAQAALAASRAAIESARAAVRADEAAADSARLQLGILIVEFAKERRERGIEVREAARAAARLRFRPILMTSFASILDSLPLVFASGAGAASRHSMGTTVVGGMLAVTALGVLLVPAFYVAVERLAARWRRGEPITPPRPADRSIEATR